MLSPAMARQRRASFAVASLTRPLLQISRSSGGGGGYDTQADFTCRDQQWNYCDNGYDIFDRLGMSAPIRPSTSAQCIFDNNNDNNNFYDDNNSAWPSYWRQSSARETSRSAQCSRTQSRRSSAAARPRKTSVYDAPSALSGGGAYLSTAIDAPLLWNGRLDYLPRGAQNHPDYRIDNGDSLTPRAPQDDTAEMLLCNRELSDGGPPHGSSCAYYVTAPPSADLPPFEFSGNSHGNLELNGFGHRRSNSCRAPTTTGATIRKAAVESGALISRRDSDFGHATMGDASPPPAEQHGASSQNGASAVLCAFIASSSTGGGSCSDSRHNGFKREDSALDKALNECNTIRSDSTLAQGVLLRCMDNQPKYKFLHLAVFDANLAPTLSSRSPSRRKMSRANAIIDDLSVDNENAEIGLFEEVFTIQKPVVSSSLNEVGLSTGRHAGYIVTSFKIYDEHYKQRSLEKNWLTWTGAREIYKYSPRTWNLRKITLYRHVDISSPISTFAYVLICEFGNILHPSNTLQALDMCERLRVRNCGHIALYQVRYNYGPATRDESTLRLGVQRNRSMSYGQNMSSPTSPLRTSPSGSVSTIPRKTSSSTHSSPSQKSTGTGQYRGAVSPRSGGTPTAAISPSTPQYWGDYDLHNQASQSQQQQAISPWSSPTMARKNSAVMLLAQRPLNTTTTSRRQMMQRGFSQDVDSAHETLRRRAALLRLRDASLGYDTPAALGVPGDGSYGGVGSSASLLASRGTSAGSMVAAGYMMGSGSAGGTPPRPVSPMAGGVSLAPPLAHRYPQQQQPHNSNGHQPRNSYIS